MGSHCELLNVAQAVTWLRSVRNPLTQTMVPLSTTRCPILHLQSALPRALHGRSLFPSGKGTSSPHDWVSMVSLANPLVSSLPWGRLYQPLLLTGLFCTCSAQAHSAAGATARPQALATWWLSVDSQILAGACGAWHSGAHVPMPGAHQALVLPLLLLALPQVGALPGAKQGSNFVVSWPSSYRLPTGKPSQGAIC